jgi:hypothetical protein
VAKQVRAARQRGPADRAKRRRWLRRRAEARKATGAVLLGVVTTAIGGVVLAGILVVVGLDPGGGPDGGTTPPTSEPIFIESGPLDISVVRGTTVEWCGGDAEWMVPAGPDEIPFGAEVDHASGLEPDQLDWSEHPVGEGGFATSPMEVYVSVQGRSDAEVVLTGLDVELVSRGPVPTGTLLTAEPCGGPGEFRWLGVDLDATPPSVVAELDETNPNFRDAPPEQRTAIAFPYEVARDDAETFLVEAGTQGCDCAWRLRLSWQSQGRSGTAVIDDRGDPFRTVATSGAVAICDVTGACDDL